MGERFGWNNRGRFQARFAQSQQEGVSGNQAGKLIHLLLQQGVMPGARAGAQFGTVLCCHRSGSGLEKLPLYHPLKVIVYPNI